MKCTIFVLLAFLTVALCQSGTFSPYLLRTRNTVQDADRPNTWANGNNNPEIEIYKAKVVGRLNASMILADQSDVKKQLLDIAMGKLEACEANLPQSARQGIHSCLGSATGQIMTLISAYETNQAIQARSSMNYDISNKDN